jgi:hypothetical protein
MIFVSIGQQPSHIAVTTLIKFRKEYPINNVRFEVSAAVTINNGVFWDVIPCGSCKNRHFGGT